MSARPRCALAPPLLPLLLAACCGSVASMRPIAPLTADPMHAAPPPPTEGGRILPTEEDRHLHIKQALASSSSDRPILELTPVLASPPSAALSRARAQSARHGHPKAPAPAPEPAAEPEHEPEPAPIVSEAQAHAVLKKIGITNPAVPPRALRCALRGLSEDDCLALAHCATPEQPLAAAMPELRLVDLAYNSIADAGLRHLGRLFEAAPGLEKLSLYENKVQPRRRRPLPPLPPRPHTPSPLAPG